MSRPGRLDGRTCLIVGGTSGIGLASARRFLRKGRASSWRAVTQEHDPVAQWSSSAHSVRSGNSRSSWRTVNRRWSRLFASALGCLGGRLDILLHVAGISGRKFGDGPLHECSSEGWDRVMRINACGVFLDQPRGRAVMLAPTDRRDRPAGDRCERGLGA